MLKTPEVIHAKDQKERTVFCPRAIAGGAGASQGRLLQSTTNVLKLLILILTHQANFRFI